MKAKFKDLLAKKKQKAQKIQNLSQCSREELQDLIMKGEKELQELQEKLNEKTSEIKKVKNDSEGFQGTIQQLQEALSDSVRQIQEKSAIIELKNSEISKLNDLQSQIVEYEKRKNLTDQLRSANLQHLREIDELKIQIQLLQARKASQNDLPQNEDKENNESVEEKLREMIKLQNENEHLKDINRQLVGESSTLKKQLLDIENSRKELQQQTSAYKNQIEALQSQIKNKTLQIQNQKQEDLQIEELRQKYEQQNASNQEKLKDQDLQIQNSIDQLQQANKLNQEMQYKIQKLEQEVEIKTTKHNNEIYRQKEYYDNLMRNLKESFAQTQKYDQQDKERISQLTIDLDNFRQKALEENKRNEELNSLVVEQQTIIDGLKIKLLSVETECQKFQKKYEQNMLKRQLAKKEVLKLTEKLERKGLQTIKEEEEIKIQDTNEINKQLEQNKNQEQQIEKKNENNEVQAQSNQENTSQAEFLAVRKFKKDFEILYKELLRLVMTAPTSVLGQNQKTQLKQSEKNPEIEQQSKEAQEQTDKKQGKNRRVASACALNRQGSNINSNILFTIPAEEFSKFERKYNNTLVQITEFLENPNNLLQADTLFLQSQGKWSTAYSNFKKNVRQKNPLKLLQCMKPPDLGDHDSVITKVAIPKTNGPVRGRLISYTGDKGGSVSQIRGSYEQKKNEMDKNKKIRNYQHF